MRSPKHPDAVCVMARRNYKVYSFIGQDRQRLGRKIVVLNTGPGPDFIRATELQSDVRCEVASGLLSDSRCQWASVSDDWYPATFILVQVDFILCDQLAAPLISGADLCEKFDESI